MSSISVFGLGYVGSVTAACFARLGHSVVGMDVNRAKVERINAGLSTVVEEGIAELTTRVVRDGTLRAVCDPLQAALETEVSLVCVGTPSRANGSIDLSHVERVCREIGTAIGQMKRRHTVVIRSTVLPGTVRERIVPALEESSGKRNGIDFGVAVNPEFLREGSSIRDFNAPPFTLIGAEDPETIGIVSRLYQHVDAPLYVTAIPVAETVKYACNSFHALKVGFANEIGRFCQSLGIDSHEVMRIFASDNKLNISAAYLRPGFAYGGSCLPKDLRALLYRAREGDVDLPLLNGLHESNRRHIERAIQLVLESGARQIAVIGLSFKPGTDDLRESPMVELIERLIGKGLKLAVFDQHVSESSLIGANREYIEREVPHVWTLMAGSLSEALRDAELVVIGHRYDELDQFERELSTKIQIDLVRAYPGRTSTPPDYQGICW
jgi:GDP-mannose 6-dehydrogenase